MTVLLVDDEPGIRRLVRDQLQDRGVVVTVAGTVAEADAALARQTFTVVILDLTLPDGSGLDILDRLHMASSTSHVIVLSGSTAEADRVDAFQRGADDFVVKPFYCRELTARVLAVRRRRDPTADAMLRIGDVRMDLRSRQVAVAGAAIDLTPKEFDLLAYLAVRPGQVFNREELLSAVWGSTSDWQQTATVTEHIRRIRKKLELDPARPPLLATVRSAGYRLDLPVTAGADTEVAAPATPIATPGVLIEVDGIIVFCDEPAAAIVGARGPAGVVGRHLVDLIAVESVAAAGEGFGLTAAGRHRRSQLVELRRDDRGEVTAVVEFSSADWHGQPAGRLRLLPVPDPHARLRRIALGILGEVTDAVIITDLHFHLRSWNTVAERLYGWAGREVWGRHILDVLDWGDDHEQVAEIWERLEHSGRWHGAGKHRARDGSVVQVLTSATLLRDDNGELAGVAVVNRAAVAPAARAPEPDPDAISRLWQALEDDEFDVHYQPMVDLRDDKIITLEALLRWEHPERGTLRPDEFLPDAERSGFIVELGAYVLETACRHAAAWRRSGADLRLSVNLSAKQLADPRMVERLTSTLGRTGLDPAFLWLELTETALVEQLEAASEVLDAMVKRGVGVAIDDFGTGWASLTYLRSFPVHALKIDGTFVAGAGRNPKDTAIIRSIVSLGAELGLFVVAEGIEAEPQRETVERLGCSFGQGYLFGRPMPAHQVPLDCARRIETDAPVTDDPARRPAPSSVLAVVGPAVEPGVRPRLPSPAPGTGRRRRPTTAVEPGWVPEAADGVESDVVAALLRGLLRVRSAPAAADLLRRTIRGMGGRMVPASEAGQDALPVDVSLGEGPPVLVEVDRLTVGRMHLERLLPRLVEDARQAVDLLRQTERLAEENARDELTGLANRRVLDRVLPRATTGSVVMMDLDHFKDVNDRHGHAAGDEVLVAFGKVLADQVRAQDQSCRIGGEEFALVLADANVHGAVELVDRIRSAWSKAAPLPVTFSAGVAAATADGGTVALLAADRALYTAKALGRDRTELAVSIADQTQ